MGFLMPPLAQFTHGEIPSSGPHPHQSAEPKKAKKSKRSKDNNATFDAFIELLEKDEGAARRMFEDNAALREVIEDMRSETAKLRVLLDFVLEKTPAPAKCEGCLPEQAPYPNSPKPPVDPETLKRLYWFEATWTKEQRDIVEEKKRVKSAAPANQEKKADYETSAKGHATYGWAVDDDGEHHNMATVGHATSATRSCILTLNEYKKLGETFTLGTGIQAKVWIVTVLEEMFPWLRHCDGHWKALKLAQDVSGNFLRNLVKGNAATPTEAVTPAAMTSTLPSGAATPSVHASHLDATPADLKRKLQDLGEDTHPTPPATITPKRSRTSGKTPRVSFVNPLSSGDAPSSLFAGTPTPNIASEPSPWDTPTPAWSTPGVPSTVDNIIDPDLHAGNSDSSDSESDDSSSDDDNPSPLPPAPFPQPHSNQQAMLPPLPAWGGPTSTPSSQMVWSTPSASFQVAPRWGLPPAPAPPPVQPAPQWGPPPAPPVPAPPPVQLTPPTWEQLPPLPKQRGRPPADPGKPYAMQAFFAANMPYNDHAKAVVEGGTGPTAIQARNTSALQLAPPPPPAHHHHAAANYNTVTYNHSTNAVAGPSNPKKTKKTKHRP